jgi:hypothetical protein
MNFDKYRSSYRCTKCILISQQVCHMRKRINVCVPYEEEDRCTKCILISQQ